MLAQNTKDEVIRLLQENKKLEAVKYVRVAHNVSLKNAVRLVNFVEKENFPGRKGNDFFRNTNRLPAVFYWVFGGVGVLLIGLASYLFYDDQQNIRHFSAVSGVVKQNRFDAEGTASPDIQYEWKGQEMIYQSTTGTNPAAFEPGEKVTVFVNPARPSEVIIDSFSERFLMITILASLGAMFLGFTVLFAKIFS